MLWTTSRSNLHTLRSIMEKVELLIHLRRNMHHCPGTLIFVEVFGKRGFLLLLLLVYLVDTPIYPLLKGQLCWFEAVNAGSVCCIQMRQDRIWLRLQMISLSVASKRLRSQPLIGLLVFLWTGFLYKLLKIFKVWWLILIMYFAIHPFASFIFFICASLMCTEDIILLPFSFTILWPIKIMCHENYQKGVRT